MRSGAWCSRPGGPSPLLGCGATLAEGSAARDAEGGASGFVSFTRATGGDLGGLEARWDRALPALRRREHSGGPWIVDMGAGTLQSPRAREFVRERLDRTVVIFVPFEDLRVRHGSRPPEDLRSMEFSADHTALCDGCPRRINGADTLERSTEELREHIRQLLRS